VAKCVRILPVSYQNIFFFDFIFLLAFINSTRGFHCGNSIYVYSVLGTSSPIYYVFLTPCLPSPFSNSIWWVSLSYLHIHNIYIYKILWSFLPLNTLSFSPRLSLTPPQDSSLFTFISHYYYHHHHHHFGSRFHVWAKPCDIWLFELDLSRSTWWFPLSKHPLKLMAKKYSVRE
jgi:hypothetical protein